MTACSPAHRYYEATGIQHVALAEDRHSAVVAKLRAEYGDSPITWCDATGATYTIQPDGAGIDAMDLAALHALWLTLAVPDPLGAEFDLLVAGPGDTKTPVSVFLEPDDSVYIISGSTITPLGDATAEQLEAEFDIGEIRDGDAHWDAESLAGLAAALDLLDPRELAALRDVDFVRDRANPDAHRDALYVHEGCEAQIYIYDNSLAAGRFRFVGDPDDPLPPVVFTILHEIGHALHEHPVRATACALEYAIAGFNDRQTAFNDRVDARNKLAERYDDPATAARVDRLDVGLDETRAEIDISRKEVSALRTRAATLARRGPIIDAFELLLGEDPPPTDYGKVSTKEAFAESFALFRADPAALRRVNLRVFDWFSSGAHHVGLEQPGASMRTPQETLCR